MKKLIPLAILAALAGCAPHKRVFLETLCQTPLAVAVEQPTTPAAPLETLIEQPPYLVVDKPTQTLYVLSQDSTLAQYPVATGRNPGQKRVVGDWRTPEGEFRLGTPEDSSNWYFEAQHRIYGPYFFRLLDSKWKSIGIHSTKGQVGTPVSRGCIRMREEDLLDFKYNYYSPYMPISIR